MGKMEEAAASAAKPTSRDPAEVLPRQVASSRFLRGRALWLKVHLYIGLFAGAVLVVIGLTGSLLVFHRAIDELLNPDLLTRRGSGVYRPLDQIVAAARAGHPGGPGPTWLILPRREGDVFLVFFDPPEGIEGRLEVMVDPHTAEVLGERARGEYLMSVVYRLHDSLLLGKGGMFTVGLLGLLLLVSIGTGVSLWWPLFWPPRSGKLHRAFTIKWGAPPIRFHFDLHKTGGVYSALVLVLIASTGVYMVFPEYARPLVNRVSPLTEFPEVKSTPRPGATPISVDQAVAAADPLFPGSELKGIRLPEGPKGVYRVVFRQPGEIRSSWGGSGAVIDPSTGAVLALWDSRRNTAGDTFLEWQFPLHNGEAFGLPGRMVVFIAGFVPLVLYVTGLKLWLKRRRSKKISRERASS